ncbi:LPXTG cell wall anchor domain-containing protein [Streptomyces chartreusis]
MREFFEDECVYFDITGLPRRVDAGDGWHEFTITVGNRLSTTMDDVDVTLIKQVNDLTPVMPGGDQNSVDLQARDRSSGQWREVGFPQPNIVANHYVTTDLVDGKPLTILLRVRVARDFPFTVTDGDHIGGVYIVVRTRRAASGRPDTRWEGSLWSGFSVFKPGTHTGETTSSPTPNGGSTPAGGGATPTGDALAETGSSSDLALLAGAGGAALAVCAGAVYAARRRRRTGA